MSEAPERFPGIYVCPICGTHGWCEHPRQDESAEGGWASEASAEQVIGEAVHGYACGCERAWPTNVNYEVLSNAVVRRLAEAGYEIVPKAGGAVSSEGGTDG